MEQINPIGFFPALAIAFAILHVICRGDAGRERMATLSETGGRGGPFAIATAVFFQNEGGVYGHYDTPGGNTDHGFAGLSLVIGIVLLLLSLYLWYMVKKGQVMTEQLKMLQGEFANLFDQAPCGYHSIDEKGYFVMVNKTLLRWLGYEKEELVGKIRFSDLLVDEKDLSAIGNLPAVLKGDVDIELKKKAGGTLPVVLSVVKRPGLNPENSRVLFSTIDNSRCKQALERIKNLDRELEAFSYSISHDLRAPLRSIDGYSRILQEDYTGRLDEEGRRVLHVIMSNAGRMGKLIDGLLEFGRLGRKSIQRSHLNMTGMVNNIIGEILLGEPNRKVDIKVAELHPAFADADMMRQVWYNLLDNAVKYTGKKEVATIEVRSYKTGEGEICYEVKDNGEGFDMRYVGKLFGVFQRLHRIRDFAGTGVGLAIVKHIISRHGGRVWAEGALHAGAVFYFTIPIEDENT